MKGCFSYIGTMIVLSAVLTILVNLLLGGIRFFPMELFTENVWRWEFGGVVVMIPWFLMLVLAGFSLLIQVLRGYNKR